MLARSHLTIMALVTAIALLLGASGAFAHAGLIGTDPASDLALDSLPDQIQLEFSEPVRPISAEWRLPDGNQQNASAEGLGNKVTVMAPAGSAAGTYVLAWRVVSDDGHPISGTLVYAVGDATPAKPVSNADRVGTAVIAAIALRFSVMLAMTLAVGGAVHGWLIAPLPDSARRLAVRSAIAAPVLAVMALGAYGLDLAGAPAVRLADPDLWNTAIREPRGWSLLLAALAALIAWGGMVWHPALVVHAIVLGAASMAVSGHAATGATPMAGQFAMFLHGLALIFWIGGLPPLLMTVGTGDARHRVRRFSALALPAVIVLIGSGLALILLKNVDVATLFASGWGLLLTAKLLLVATMLMLALQNRLMLTPAMARDAASAVRLRRNIGAEIGLGAIVLLMAMSFRLTPPPGISGPPERAASTYLRLEGTQASADLMLMPEPPGRVAAVLYLVDPLGDAMVAQSVVLTFNDMTKGARTEVAATRSDDGGWRSEGFFLDSEGPWQVEGIAAIGGGQLTSFRAVLPRPGD